MYHADYWRASHSYEVLQYAVKEMIKNLPIRKDHDIVEIMREPLQHKFLKIFPEINTNNNKDKNDKNDLGKSAKRG